MRSKVELFWQIRRDHEYEGLSTRALARKYGMHRRTVREALACAVPASRKRPEGRPAPALGAYRGLIDEWLTADLRAPRRQRHTARRIWRRLVDEHGAVVSERQVRRWVRERRQALGELVEEAFVPLVHDPGREAEVDWGQADVVLGGVQRTVFLFLMRACFSGACFVIAFTRETQQAFLEAHVAAFGFFGGAFATVRYDNLGEAVKKVMKGRRRVETDRFVALRSHYMFEAEYTRPGREGAHEKGGVEGDVGRFRRNHLVPVPAFVDLAELNDHLAGACIADLRRTITGRRETVGAALGREAGLLRALPGEAFDAAEVLAPRVDAKALVTVKQSRYSVPVGLVGRRVAVRVGAREIEIRHDGALVARHARLDGRFETAARLDHYLELLALKPGALGRSLALRQERERGAWPPCYDELWQAIAAKVGPSEAARQMVDVLLLVREHGAAQVALAVRGALTAGAHDGRAVAVLAARAERAMPAPLVGLDDRLAAAGPPQPDLSGYDQLLGRREGSR
jgi:transposase